MIARSGRIVAIHDGMATIRVERPAACSACGSRGTCGSASAATTVTTVTLPVGAASRPGDVVSLAIAEGTLARSALLMYFLPAASTLLGAVGMAALGDLAAIAGAGSGLGLGLILIRLLARRHAGVPAVLPAPTFDPKLIGEP